MVLHRVVGPDNTIVRPFGDLYVAQSAVVATRLGVIDPPTTVAGLDASLESYRPELAGTPAARDAARFLLLHPPLADSARAGYGVLACPAQQPCCRAGHAST